MVKRKMVSIVSCLSLTLGLASMALAKAPTFTPALWGDGVMWGTKGTTELPPPTPKNLQSYDQLFVIVNSNNPAGQLPVSEAAPRNPDYNGGRWITMTAEWTQDGFDVHGTVPVLMSYEDVLYHEGEGHLSITMGSPGPMPPPYFQCPLLPVKIK